MTAEDRLRSRLHREAASMPTGPGSLTDVQARAAQLQRRRTVVRSGAGAFVLAAVALAGIVSLRNGSINERSATTADADDAAEAAAMADTSESGMAESGMAESDMAESDMVEPDIALSEAGDALSAIDERPEAGDDMADDDTVDAEMADEEMAAGEMAAEALAETTTDQTDSQQALSPASSEAETAVFATTVSTVKPPPAPEGAALRYSFSGRHALAQTADSWYAYDGTDWQPVVLPDHMEVAAVDLTESGRIAVLGVMQPLECDRAQVVAVRIGTQWSYVHVNDDTPPAVGWELLDARVRVTDTGIELERSERLWLDDKCADTSATLTGSAAELVTELRHLGEIRRDSQLYARLNGGFAQRWPEVARFDVRAATTSDAVLDWTDASPPEHSTPALRLTPNQQGDSNASAAVLGETTVLGVTATMRASGAMVVLQRGEQTWEICPIANEELELVHGEIGWAGEHLAVIVGKPNQTLFLVERNQ